MKTKKADEWIVVSLLLLALFVVFLLFPMVGLLKQSVFNSDGQFSLDNFRRFFTYTNGYYLKPLANSVKVTIVTTLVSLLLGVPIAYFYSFYKIRGAKFLFVVAILCSMSAPFIGAYSWILLLGRSGAITKFLSALLGVKMPAIYGFKGILLVQSLKFFPLVFIYMNGAFKNIDNTLMEAAANMGCTGVRRLVKIVLSLSMPTILAAALMVFMQAFADFGTPMLIGEGYQTFPVMIYNAYLGEGGADRNFAAALAVVAVVITAIVFAIQKWGTNRFKFSMNALHPVEKKEAKGVFGFLMHAYCYLLVGIAFMPQLYIIYLSFCNYKGSIRQGGYGLGNYVQASKKLLSRSIKNTAVMGIIALIVIVILAVLIAYLVVRRANALNNAIDTISMLPYIMPGAVVGLALLLAFGKKPLALTGTFAIMVISFVIRRLPYTIRSATATLMQISPSIEEAAISLGASKAKTFVRITVPMMANGILSGAILSWVAIVTELSSSIILYSNKSITLTMSTYLAILRGNDGIAAAFAAILTVVTAVSLLLYLKVSKSEDVRL
ncbi:MAG: iron ABC transporter permease [Candidatus Ventricola sp.]|nr:iron ABC transporter permease [Clostridiales bacterium]MDY3764157.1 iron ABC transporter permease [Candidatus Ventricola sp.]MDY3832215.1 iron ABC transporter permease [Candidatus Ventricola sp.]